MKKIVITSMILALSNGAMAQSGATPSPTPAVVDVTSSSFKQKLEEVRTEAPLLVTKETVGSALAPEERKRLEAIANQITDKSLQRYHSNEAKQYEASALQMKRRADDIADEALAGNREKVLKFLGVDVKSNANVYYFVSFSMPQELLRAYVLEAMWSGGTIVLKGVPQGRTIKEFFTEDLRQLIYGKGAAANISLDPRLFEAYDVQAVPAIVYTEDRSQLACTGKGASVLVANSLSYETCQPIASNKYWKITGAVTADYALQAFEDKGALGAQVFHNALRKGLSPGVIVPKTQEAFKGEWKDAITPSDLMANKQALEEAYAKQSTVVRNPPAATLPNKKK